MRRYCLLAILVAISIVPAEVSANRPLVWGEWKRGQGINNAKPDEMQKTANAAKELSEVIAQSKSLSPSAPNAQAAVKGGSEIPQGLRGAVDEQVGKANNAAAVAAAAVKTPPTPTPATQTTPTPPATQTTPPTPPATQTTPPTPPATQTTPPTPPATQTTPTPPAAQAPSAPAASAQAQAQAQAPAPATPGAVQNPIVAPTTPAQPAGQNHKLH